MKHSGLCIRPAASVATVACNEAGCEHDKTSDGLVTYIFNVAAGFAQRFNPSF
ncbi:MAG: hypothetical protein LBK65_06735 [Tannerellaceae bacterium]|jgi:hypothetical protein|nr:hypothetical protein [Tannerellaceae bacterium]